MASFTTVRNLGTKGSMYDDVGLKIAIEKGVVPGPRMICATRAIVAKGAYGPRSESPDVVWPQGAAEVANMDEMMAEVRTQISKGADLIKVYADYRWGLDGEAKRTTSNEVSAATGRTSRSSSSQTAEDATTTERIWTAIKSSVSTS